MTPANVAAAASSLAVLVALVMGVLTLRQWHRTRYGEWFQWLAERMDENPAKGKSQRAHLFHRSWRP